MTYKKVIMAQNTSDIEVEVYRDNSLVGRKVFGYTDSAFWIYLFGTETTQRESKFQLAHKWADAYITQMQKYEV